MTTKFCRDCRHSDYQHAVVFWGRGPAAMAEWLAAKEASRALAEDMKCRHPRSGVLSVVTGAKVPESCNAMRATCESSCGPDAALWEAPDAQDS